MNFYFVLASFLDLFLFPNQKQTKRKFCNTLSIISFTSVDESLYTINFMIR